MKKYLFILLLITLSFSSYANDTVGNTSEVISFTVNLGGAIVPDTIGNTSEVVSFTVNFVGPDTVGNTSEVISFTVAFGGIGQATTKRGNFLNTLYRKAIIKRRRLR